MKTVVINKLAIDPLASFAETAAEGAEAESTNVPITHVTAVSIREKLDNLNKANDAFQSVKSSLVTKQKELDDAFQEALTFSQTTRDLLKPKFGNQYSKVWDQVGFFNRSLMIPRSVPKTMGLVKSMGLFLEGHPELAVTGVATAALANAAFAALSAAYTAKNLAKTDLRQKRAARDVGITDMREQLLMLRRELAMLLPKDDPRWLAFGFNVPADVSVPAAPEGLTVAPGLPGHSVLSWGHTVNAARFHVWKQVVGIDEEPVRVATVKETSKDMEGLTSGAHVKWFVTAVNVAGDGMPSETVEAVVP